MMNKIPTVVSCALGIIRDYYKEKFNINKINDRELERILMDWYNHSDIADSTILAAMAIHGEFNCNYDYDLIIQITNDYFPTYFDELAALEAYAKEFGEINNGEDFMY